MLSAIPSLIVSSPTNSPLASTSNVPIEVPVLASLSPLLMVPPSLTSFELVDSPPDSSAVSSARPPSLSVAEASDESDFDGTLAASRLLQLRDFVMLYSSNFS